jgi:predicted alpha/beta superfamily hydrolase
MVPILVAMTLQSSQTPPVRKSSLTGEIRIHREFPSKSFRNKRNVSVYLPPNYGGETKRRYSVLYMHDGQNVFDGMTSYIPNAEWRADEAAQALIESNAIEPVIIVAIDNAQADRANEFLPTRSREMGGKAKDYGRFLVEEVMPFVYKTYRTKTGPSNTAIAGSSFGGVITACVGMQYPDVFGKLAILSPSVWWDNRVLLKMVAAMPKKTNQKIWIDIGTAEGSMAVRDTHELADTYTAKGWKLGKDLFVYVDRDAEHNERAWASRMGEILLTFFRK